MSYVPFASAFNTVKKSPAIIYPNLLNLIILAEIPHNNDAHIANKYNTMPIPVSKGALTQKPISWRIKIVM